MRPTQIFHCRKCGECCKGYGGTFISETDIVLIADYVGTDPNSFLNRYCTYSGKQPILRQRPDGYCIFWDTICQIHPVKPRMCKAWPFIPSVVIDTQNWHTMAASCPGMRTDISNDMIRQQVLRKLQDTASKSTAH